MKKIPWNRFTKHLCVFVVLAIVALSHFWTTYALAVLLLLLIPVVHRIERNYRGDCRDCKICRRVKPVRKFSGTVCTECANRVEAFVQRQKELSAPVVPKPSPYPGSGRMPHPAPLPELLRV